MRRRPGGLLLALVGICAASLGPAVVARGSVEWRTYAFSVGRSGLNPSESALGTTKVKSLHQVWSVNLGGFIDAQPVLASGVKVSPHRSVDVVYVGTELGRFVAVNAGTGAPIWSRNLGSAQRRPCDFDYGVSGTAVIDRRHASVYAAGGNGKAYDLDLATGKTKRTWRITDEPLHEHVWSALTLARGILYIPVAGSCNDLPPYRGRVVAVATATGAQAATWYVTPWPGEGGGGIWAFGGVSADPAADAIYTATGNSIPPSRNGHAGYAEHVVRLTGKLHVSASQYPGLPARDADFGATPLLYRAAGCPRQLAVGAKYGEFYVYDRDRVGHGPVQRIQLSGSVDGFHALLGVAAFWRAKRLLYVQNPGLRGPYHPGILAFRVTRKCRLAPVWQAKGPAGLGSSPTVANGVLYYGNGAAGKVVAFNAKTGKRLWSSGDVLDGAVYAAPSVVGGAVYVGAWDGLHAFAPRDR